MSNEHLILCGGVQPSTRKQSWRNAKRVELDIARDGGNVNLRISDLTEALRANLTDVELDLLELATYVYCADQATTRGGNKQIDYGEAWYRDFRFEIPVRRPEFWSSDDVQRDLGRCLNDLSGDNFEFAFSALAQRRRVPEYFEFGHEEVFGIREVVLFSGGLDSLSGAVQEILCSNRKVALVSHRANPKIDARQKQLVADLTSKVADRANAPVHISVLVNKAKELNKEYTQRTRSFLFSSIAAVVARLFGVKRIRFYENGVTSLNLPISPQVVSTRASRTTHPKPLAGICSLFSRVFPDGFGIENPFFWKTKTEVLQALKQSGHSALCSTSVSCAHTWEMTTAHPHCGKCSQCIDRRLTALAAGLDDNEDPVDHYRFKLFTDPLAEQLDRILVESYVEVVNRIQRCDNATRFCTEFPEVSRVLNHIPATADDAARAIFDLYRRHADQVGGALDAQGRDAFPRLRRGELDDNCLLRMMGGGLRQVATADEQRQDQTVRSARDEIDRSRVNGLLKLDDAAFSVTWNGRPALEMGNLKEFHFLAVLATSPNQYISHADIAQRLGGDQLDKVTHIKSRLAKLLKDGGLEDLADCIKAQKGHYGLFIA